MESNEEVQDNGGESEEPKSEPHAEENSSVQESESTEVPVKDESTIKDEAMEIAENAANAAVSYYLKSISIFF